MERDVYLGKGIILKQEDIGELLQDNIYESDMEIDGIDFIYSEYAGFGINEGIGYWFAGKIISQIDANDGGDEEIGIEDIPGTEDLKEKLELVLQFPVDINEIRVVHFCVFS
jgi:hypothetical protein